MHAWHSWLSRLLQHNPSHMSTRSPCLGCLGGESTPAPRFECAQRAHPRICPCAQQVQAPRWACAQCVAATAWSAANCRMHAMCARVRPPRQFHEALEAREPDDKKRERLALRVASAWYRVTYDPECALGAKAGGGACSGAAASSDYVEGRLLSFPWILAEYLAHVKRYGA